MQESKRILLTIDSIMKKMEKHKINFNHPLQRASEQWSKVMIGNLISDILQENPLPELVFAEREDIIGNIFGIDGNQRCTNIKDFINNKYKISDKIDRYMIEYPVPILDQDRNPCKDDSGFITHRIKAYDIRGKKYEDLPKELQERIIDYQFDIVLPLYNGDVDWFEIRYKGMLIYSSGVTASTDNEGTSYAICNFSCHYPSLSLTELSLYGFDVIFSC